MTVHNTAVKVDVFPDEFKPLLKFITRAMCSSEIRDALTNVEMHKVEHWFNDFQDLALENAE